jgi:hypothetical protein
MSELTPRMQFPYPSDREQPFFTSYRSGELARDASHWALSENDNLVFAGGGTWTWTAGTGVLSWSADLLILGFTSPTKSYLLIPAGSIVVEDEEVVFFNVLRLLQTNANATLEKGPTIAKPGVRLHDLMLFAARVGDVIYFPGFKSMVDGDAGSLYGGGLPGGGGGSVNFITEGPGIDVTNPGGPNVTVEAEFTAAGGTNGVGVQVARNDHTHAALGHDHEIELLIEPGAGVSLLNLDADAVITAKTLLDAKVYRNGQRLTQGGLRDYTLNLPAKTASLNFLSIASDKFVIDRRTV